MADISLGGNSLPTQQVPSVRPPERTESERREAVDSDIERREAERSENALQNKADDAAIVVQRRENSDGAGRHVDVLA